MIKKIILSGLVLSSAYVELDAIFSSNSNEKELVEKMQKNSEIKKIRITDHAVDSIFY